MIIAIASGKGGTGKTTVATNLAATLAERHDLTLVDCDVEEPNCRLFLDVRWRDEHTIYVPVPEVDEAACRHCGKCAEVCQFNALACLPSSVIVSEELCHGCGACGLVCPEDAIAERGREVGVIREGECPGFSFVEGRMRVGEAMASPLIRAVRNRVGRDGLVMVDAPPGTSCPAIAAVNGVDFVLLVAEPTPFGLNDLELAVATVRELDLPFAVAVNRSDVGDSRVDDYCRREGIDVLLRVPNDRRIAEAYSQGVLATAACPEYHEDFQRLFDEILSVF